MSITFTRASGTRDGGNTTSHQITVPAAGHAVGSAVFVALVGGTDPGATTCADNHAGSTNSWHVTENFWDAGNFSFVLIAWCVLTTALASGDLITLTTTNGTDSQMSGDEYAAGNGWATTSTPDTNNHNSNSFGLPWVTGSVTPTGGASVLLFGAIASDNNAGTSAPTANWNERLDHIGATAGRGIVVQDRIIASAAGSVNEGGTWSANNDGPAAVVVLRESAAGLTAAQEVPAFVQELSGGGMIGRIDA